MVYMYLVFILKVEIKTTWEYIALTIEYLVSKNFVLSTYDFLSFVGKQPMYNGQAVNQTTSDTASSTSQLFPSSNTNQSSQASTAMFGSTQQAPYSTNQMYNPSASSTPPPQPYKPSSTQAPTSSQSYNQTTSGYTVPTCQAYSQSYNYQPTNGVPPSVSAPTQSYSGTSQAQVYIGGDKGYSSGSSVYGGSSINPYSRTAGGGGYPQQPPSTQPASGYDYSASGQYPNTYQPPYPNY